MAGARRCLPRDLPLSRPPAGDGAAVPSRRPHPRAGRREPGGVVTELFAMLMSMVVWAARYPAAHIAFATQRVKLAPLMRTFRNGLVPLTLVAPVLLMGFASVSLGHALPAPTSLPGGSNVEPPRAEATRRDGISLDQAVRMAESQFNARVVRTDVQDED